MKTVTQQFLNEQSKRVSGGVRWSYMLYSRGESFDLNPYLMNSALSTLDWRIEEELTEFVPPDIQFSVWYDAGLWTWLLDHEDIVLKVREKFTNVPDDEHLTFWGYVDKDNLHLQSEGRIDVRAYGFAKYLSTIKTSTIFGDPPSPPYTVPIQDIIDLIFTNIGITEGAVKVLPIDSYPDGETYVASHLYASIAPTSTRWSMLRVSDAKFYFMDGIWLWLITFNEDYSRVSAVVVEYAWGGDAVSLVPWGDNFAVVAGTQNIYNYKWGTSWYTTYDWRATYIHIFDDSGVRQGSAVPVVSFSYGGATYYPMARAIHHWDQSGGYVVVYNGCLISTQVDRSAARYFDDSHAVLNTQPYYGYYFHPWMGSTAGRYDGDYVVAGLCPNTNFSGPPRIVRVRPDYSLHTSDLTGQNVASFPVPWETIGKYVCFKSHTSAFNINGGLETGFWSLAPNFLGRSTRQGESNEPYHFLTGYNTSSNKLIVKELGYASRGIITEIVDDALPSGFTVLAGFTYWKTHRDKHCMFGMAIDTNPAVPLYGITILANQFFPFVYRSPLNADESVYETLKSLAIAGCCLFHFPEEGKGFFISRAYWQDNVLYQIDQSLFTHNWEIMKREPVKVTVTSGSTSGSVGDEVGELSINCPYLPSYSESILRAYAQAYYYFLADNPYEITLVGDFLIQYEVFDQVAVVLNQETYIGRIKQSTQERVDVTLKTRSRRV